MKVSAAQGDIDGAQHWLDELLRRRLQPDTLTWNSLLSCGAYRGDLKVCENLYQRMEASNVEPDTITYSTMRTACARSGNYAEAQRWLKMVLQHNDTAREIWSARGKTEMDPFSETGGPLKKALYRFRSEGDETVAEHLERALEYQWVYGYPRVPLHEKQLTHGAYKYMAGMQPMTAREIYRIIPESKTVLDTFCGSGTVLIEGLVAGKQRCVGCDASPLAIFVSRSHTDAKHLHLEDFLTQAEAIATPGSTNWESLRDRIRGLRVSAELRDGLWFVYAIAWRLARAPFAGTRSSEEVETQVDARAYFLSTAYRFADQLRQLRAEIHGEPGIELHCCDCRKLVLDEHVDAILTSPPYPGVYDYLKARRYPR